MVEGMSVVVNVMLSLMECDEPTSCLVQPIVVKICTLGVLALGVSLVS